MRKLSFRVWPGLARARRLLARRPIGALSDSSFRTPESLQPSARLPHSRVPEPQWPFEHCANEPESFLGHSERVAAAARWAGVAIFALGTMLPAFSAVREVGPIGITVGNLEEEVKFFTQVLPFDEVSRSELHGRALENLLDLKRAKVRTAELRLGRERLVLTEHRLNPGRPIPADSRSYDRWFQHIAIVVSDMDRAYAQLRLHKVKHVSTGPQVLPAWNTNAAGIKAFYFRDPEEHVLELIQFPAGKGDPKWQLATDKLFLGIDHTAIVVSDTDISLEFYQKQLGLRVAGRSENYGTEQEHLNQVFGARLRITALRAERGPGIEFLEYVTPPSGRPMPANSRANDLWFWQTALTVEGLEEVKSTLRENGAHFVSQSAGKPDRRSASAPVIVRDPDGHALELLEWQVSAIGTLSTKR